MSSTVLPLPRYVPDSVDLIMIVSLVRIYPYKPLSFNFVRTDDVA